MLKVLENRKEALEETLQRKLEELKIICLKEGELTGELPPETPIIDGKPCPQIRRRVGTAFAFSDKLTVNSSSKEKEALAKMELEYEIQSKITTASLKLANDINARKSVRKQRQMSYQLASAKLQEVQHKLLSMKRQVEAIENLESKSFENNNVSVGAVEDRLCHLSNDNDVFCEAGIISCEQSIKSAQSNRILMCVPQPPDLCTPVLSPYIPHIRKNVEQDVCVSPETFNTWNFFQNDFQSSISSAHFEQIDKDGSSFCFQNGKYSENSTPHNQSFYSTSSEDSTNYNSGKASLLRRVPGNRLDSGMSAVATSLYNSPHQPSFNIENQENLFALANNVSSIETVSPRSHHENCNHEHYLKNEICNFENELSDCSLPTNIPNGDYLSHNKTNELMIPCEHDGPVVSRSYCDQNSITNHDISTLKWLNHPVPHDAVYTSCCCCSTVNCSNSLLFKEPDYTQLVEMHISEKGSNCVNDSWKCKEDCSSSSTNNFKNKERQIILETPADYFAQSISPEDAYSKLSYPCTQTTPLASQSSLSVSTATLSKSPSKTKTKEWIETLLDSPLPPKKTKPKKIKPLSNELIIQESEEHYGLQDVTTVPSDSDKDFQQNLKVSRECLSSPSPTQFTSSSPLPSPKPKLSTSLPLSYQSTPFVLQQESNINSMSSKASEILLSLSPTTPFALHSGAEVSVVTVGHFQPYWEETKPYELSDFYKYSKKHRKQQQESKQMENNCNGNDSAKKANSIPDILIEKPSESYSHDDAFSTLAEDGDISQENEKLYMLDSSLSQTSNDNQPLSDAAAIAQSLNEEFFIHECDKQESLADAFHDEMLAWYEEQGPKKATLV